MRRNLLATLILTGLAATASAQTPATLRLTVDEAVRLALQNNPDLKADRLDPQISDTRIAFATERVQAVVQHQRAAEQPAPAARRLSRADADAQRRDHVERRLQPAPAVVRHVLLRVLERDAHQQRQLPQRLQPAAAVGALGQCVAAAPPQFLRRYAAPRARDEPREPRHRRHAAERERRAHDGGREDRLLESGRGQGQRRSPAEGVGAGPGTGAGQQGQGGCRTVAAARPGVGAGRGRVERGTAHRRADRRQGSGGSAAPADPRHHAARHVDRPDRRDRLASGRPSRAGPRCRGRHRAARSRRSRAGAEGDRELPVDASSTRAISGCRTSASTRAIRRADSAARRCSDPAGSRARLSDRAP